MQQCNFQKFEATGDRSLIQSISPIVDFLEQNVYKPKRKDDWPISKCYRMTKVILVQPELWCTVDQILSLIQVIQSEGRLYSNLILLLEAMCEGPLHIYITRLSIDMAKRLAKVYMGIESAPFDEINPAIGRLRTSFKDKTVKSLKLLRHIGDTFVCIVRLGW